ncbi:Similar to dhx8: ATP-dependent RNA helicase dhx8 (Dictyostelium discoideum) [Cotesia congregata]|uniref:Similar to dhx8: ATP-dependent RNA helicase dhx8 (Dictyostelium discoideum) n=1 Tax=Cotesia congregata TaxID=51543 RepID=A0A8J2HP13_COTCN|nr:Similar to dhx8: ATP-dependent RNA helicase dhx8 (Dictyostelium discoideum) [Cotesia congregata]
MLDVGHEMTVYIDVLSALLKQILQRRPELKLIITTSASILLSENCGDNCCTNPSTRITGRYSVVFNG